MFHQNFHEQRSSIFPLKSSLSSLMEDDVICSLENVFCTLPVQSIYLVHTHNILALNRSTVVTHVVLIVIANDGLSIR
jgi:hypothetical protein